MDFYNPIPDKNPSPVRFYALKMSKIYFNSFELLPNSRRAIINC